MSFTEESRIGKVLDFLRFRKRHYQAAFGSPSGQQVMIDLARFCRASEPTVVKDATGKIDRDMTFILEGRREVWLRIQHHLNLSSEQLMRLYNGQPASNPGENDGEE